MTIHVARHDADAGSAAAVVGRALAQAHASTLNDSITILDRRAASRADAIDATDVAPRPPLAGVPFAVKDNLALDRTTCASRILEAYVSPFDATCVARLEAAGAVPIAKTNLDEFAMGSSTERSCFGPTLNPWDPARVPGGSSGGSAAMVAAGTVPFALGSDTGGSVRQPAAFCGIVGLKPTYGRVSRHGLVAYASSLDQVGVLATCVHDAAFVLDTIAGFDPLDSTSSARTAGGWASQIDHSVHGLVVGVPRTLGEIHAGVAEAMERTLAAVRLAGGRIVEFDLPRPEETLAAYYVIATAEASSNLARFDGIRYGRRADAPTLDEVYTRSRTDGLGEEVQRRILLGTFVLSSGYLDAYYTTALRARRLVADGYAAAFARGCHVLLTPTTPTPAFRIGEKTSDPLAMVLADVFTVGPNLAGLPAIAIPAGFTREGDADLPVSVQLIAPPWDEGTLLRAARMIEREGPPWRAPPPVRSRP